MRFFKAGKGQYGEGDIFIGVTVPEQRAIAKKYKALPLGEIKKLLESKIHEHRLTALLILGEKREKAPRAERAAIAKFFLAHRTRANNWDLVDSSARDLLGNELLESKRSRLILDKLARSKSLWDRRIAIVATHAYIEVGELGDTFRISAVLMEDKEDLMHKACGWMLREAGKKDRRALSRFLDTYAVAMPRTMLRYALEHYGARDRARYMSARKRV